MSSSAFTVVSWEDALAEEETSPWVIDRVLATGSTLIYGTTEAGKSFLTSVLVASLATGRDFLGFGPPDRVYKPFIGWTDDGGRAEYRKRISDNLKPGDQPHISFAAMPEMTNIARWSDLFEQFKESGSDILILDNLTDFIPSPGLSDDNVARAVFQGVRLFTRNNIPVILVGHSSTARNEFGQMPTRPMGSSLWTQSVRWRWFIQRSSTEHVKIEFAGNQAPKHTVSLIHGIGARFQVAAEQAKEPQSRNPETYDLNEAAAQWVVENGTGMSVAAVARGLADAFQDRSGNSAETWRQQLTRRSLKRMVVKQPDGSWMRVSA